MDVRTSTPDDAVTNVDELADAVDQGRDDVVRQLAQTVEPRSVSLLLHRFAGARRPEAVRVLLDSGADPNVLDESGANALHHAAAADDLASAEALIEAGADLDLRDREHASSPVLWAENFHHREMVQLLLRRGARVNLQEAGKLGLTSVIAGFLDVVPEAIDVTVGWPTALTGAVAGGHLPAVRLLLERGADPNAPAGNGEKPLQATMWVDEGAVRDEISALLRDHGATT
ncbi:MAG TPA: ankyrin repeat domain-containing protein [Actinopolymorphaceae bacterium]|nr:ankyrin repeat domain-containing protein [Actinopolymorphaceae bacterium]